MKTRVVILDTSNRKLLWKEALTRAAAQPESDPAPRMRWWEKVLVVCDRALGAIPLPGGNVRK